MIPNRKLSGLLLVAMCAAVMAGQDAPPPEVASVPKPATPTLPAERTVSIRVAELLAASAPKFKMLPDKSEAVPLVSAATLGEKRAPESFGWPSIFFDAGPASSNDVIAQSQPKATSSSAVVPLRTGSLITANRPAALLNVYLADAVTPTDAINLPPVLVGAAKLRLPDKEQIMSRDEFAALLRKRYPGASVPGQDPSQIANGMPNYARLQFESDRRNAQKASFEDFADLLERTGDRPGSKQLKKEIQAAFGGANTDPLIDAMDKSANGWRR